MQVWLAIDEDSEAMIYDTLPCRDNKLGIWESDKNCFKVLNQEADKIVGFKMTWEDEPIKIDIKKFHRIASEIEISDGSSRNDYKIK